MRRLFRMRTGTLIFLPVAAVIALGSYVLWELSKTLKLGQTEAECGPVPEDGCETPDAAEESTVVSGTSEDLQPESGRVFITPEDVSAAPLTAEVQSPDNCYIYLQYMSAPQSSEPDATPGAGEGRSPDVAFYVSGDSSVTLNVPVGTYSLFYASGKEWHGLSGKFGPGTRYFKANGKLSFYVDGKYLHGNTLRLRPGDPAFTEIDAAEFPG